MGVAYDYNINKVLNTIGEKGDSAYEVYKKQWAVDHPSDPEGYLSQAAWLASLKGPSGDPGRPAVNPFKGWFGSLEDLEAEQPAPHVGDYANVEVPVPGQSETVVRIFKCRTTGVWMDSGVEVDTSNLQTFDTGEQVNELGIDETHLDTPREDALPKAIDCAKLKSKLRDIELSEIEVPTIEINGKRVAGSSGLPIGNDPLFGYVEVEIPNVSSVRFIGLSLRDTETSTAANVGYAFGHYVDDEWVTDKAVNWIKEGSVRKIMEYYDSVPEGSTHFRTTVQYYTSLNHSQFYLYAGVGTSISKLIFDSIKANGLKTMICHNGECIVDKNGWVAEASLSFVEENEDGSENEETYLPLIQRTVLAHEDETIEEKQVPYSYNSQTRTFTYVSSSDFVGFPEIIYFKKRIYVFYKHGKAHKTVPGFHFNRAYRFSEDGGVTWSDEYRIDMPLSDSQGHYRAYEHVYPCIYNGKLVASVFCTVSKDQTIDGETVPLTKKSITFLAQIDAMTGEEAEGSEYVEGCLKCEKIIKAPFYDANGDFVFDYLDSDELRTMIPGGRGYAEDGYFYFPCYFSPDSACIIRWRIDFDTPISASNFIEIARLAPDGSSGEKYTESCVAKVGDNLLWVVRTSKTNHGKYARMLASIDGGLTWIESHLKEDFHGMTIEPLSDTMALIIGRDFSDTLSCDRFCIVNSLGHELMARMKYDGNELAAGDSCYAATAIIGDYLFMAYYRRFKDTGGAHKHDVVFGKIRTTYLTDSAFWV